MTKKEKKRREKAAKAQRKQEKKNEKERQKKIKAAIKEKEEREKGLAKQQKKAGRERKGKTGNSDKNPAAPEMRYEDVEDEVAKGADLASLQTKYADILGVAPEEITNAVLYGFIDEWMGTPYKMGGETKMGIDCSSFAQRLFIRVYDQYIERTAQKQKNSKDIALWSDPQHLQEGDFVFFRASGDHTDTITHVGVYLTNNKFVNATSRKGKGNPGVKISDLSDSFWKKRFYAGGRRITDE